VEVYAKCEWLNPGGSVKDRAASAILAAVETSGALRPGVRLLDSSSGNTGIAYGMMCAHRGWPLTLCLPANANRERKRVLRAYGVEVVETDPLEGSDGAIRKARALVAEFPDRYLYLDQYGHGANPLAHQRGTAEEIWRQTEGRVTHWVATLGTSGTFVGTTRGLKAHNPAIRCISVQPSSPFHGLEGLKHMASAIVPRIYDASLADADLGAPTEESLELRNRLAREEGLLVGVSSGAALWGALQVARGLSAGVVVTLFPDGGERYTSEDHLWA
jgi:cysteine synthase B